MRGCLTCLRKLYTATGHITSTVYTIYIYTHILRDITIFIFSSLGFAAISNWSIPRLLSLLLSRMQPKRLSDYCSSFYDKLGYNHKISWIQWVYNNLYIHICVCMLVCSGTPTPRRPQYETTCLSLGVVLGRGLGWVRCNNILDLMLCYLSLHACAQMLDATQCYSTSCHQCQARISGVTIHVPESGLVPMELIHVH